ncbi:MAG: tetratricopeptide repeat protein [Desulfomonilaceae bacterium]
MMYQNCESNGKLCLRDERGSSVYSFLGYAVLAVLVVVLLFVFPWSQLTGPKASADVAAGNDAMSKKQFDKAIVFFEKALKANPDDAVALIGRSRAALQLGDIEKALNDANTAIQKSPTYADAYGQRGVIFKMKQQAPEAIKDFSKAVELNNNYAWAYAQRADLYSRTQEQEKALKDADRALKSKPDFVEGLRLRAWILSRMGKCKEASEDFQKVAKLSPNDAWSIQDTAWFLLTCPDEKLQDATKAMELAQKAAQMSADQDGVFQETIAEAFFKQGDALKAIDHQKKAIEMGSKKCPDGSCIKEMQERLKKYELAARQEIRKAYEFLPIDSAN